MTKTYRARTEETWDKARSDYLAGETAERVCARYDLGVSNFHKRAREEGWRRADQPDPEPHDDPDDEGLPDADLEATADLALRRMAACVQRGRAAEALRWQRLHAGLSDRIRATADRAEAQRRQAEQQRIADARETRVRASLAPGATQIDYIKARLAQMIELNPHEVQQVQKVQADSEAAPVSGPLNRSERRRLRRQLGRTGQGTRPEPPP